MRPVVGPECSAGPAPVRPPILQNLSQRRSGRGRIITWWRKSGPFRKPVCPVTLLHDVLSPV